MKILRYVIIVLAAVAAVYLVFQGRTDRSPAPRPAPAVQAPEPAGPAIVQFYPEKSELARGERSLVCYGVANTSAVRIEPPVEQLDPTPSRCFWVTPERTTTYKLIATGAGGAEVSQSFTITVGAPPPRILFVQLSSETVPRGGDLTLCYGVDHATQVRLEPSGLKLDLSAKKCMLLSPLRTTKYTLVAIGAGGRSDRASFTVTVR
jgi:hypothetical protein